MATITGQAKTIVVETSSEELADLDLNFELHTQVCGSSSFLDLRGLDDEDIEGVAETLALEAESISNSILILN